MKLSKNKWGIILPLIRVLFKAKNKAAAKLLKMSKKSAKWLLYNYPILLESGSIIMKKDPKIADNDPITSNLCTSFFKRYIIGMIKMPCKFVNAKTWLCVVFLEPHILKLCHIIYSNPVIKVSLKRFIYKLFGFIYYFKSKKLNAVSIEFNVLFDILVEFSISSHFWFLIIF